MIRVVDIFIKEARENRFEFLSKYRNQYGRENSHCKECYDAWPQNAKRHICGRIQQPMCDQKEITSNGEK